MANEIEILVKSKDQTKAGAASAKKNLEEIGDSAKRVGEVAQGVLAADWFGQIGDAAMRGVQSTFTAAKDLGESVNAVNVSFGASAAKIHEWGQNNATSFGLSTRAFNQFAVPLGAVMKNVGLDMDTVSNSTIELTERAADMASVFNADVSEVLEAIQAGLRGEADPLEKFGVGLSAAAVEAKALAMSGKDSAEALTEQEKMLGRVALIMEQTSQVQGDFANTSDDAANAQRRASAAWENTQAALGQVFLPVVAAVAQAVEFLADQLQGLPGPLRAVIAVVLALTAAAVVVVPRLIAVKATLEGVGISAGRATALLGGMLTGIGLLVAAGQALGQAFADELDTSELKAMDEQLTELFKKDPSKAAAKFDEWASMVERTGISAEMLAGMLPDYAAAQAEAEAATKDGADAQGEFAEKIRAAKDELAEAQAALDEYLAAQRAAVDPVLGLMDALEKVDEAQGNFNEALKSNGESSAEARKAARDMASAVLEAEGAASDADLSFDAFEGKLRQWVHQGKISQDTADVLRESIKGARGQADMFAGKRVASLLAKVAGLEESNAKLNWLARTRQAIVAITTVGDTIGGFFGGRASGGLVGVSHAAAGGPRGNRVLVGEQGPELVDLAPGSMVHPAGTTQAMLAAGGGGVQRIELFVTSAGTSRFEDAIAEILREYVRVRGAGDVQRALGQ